LDPGGKGEASEEEKDWKITDEKEKSGDRRRPGVNVIKPFFFVAEDKA
jgi:hypothetical protein